jgi:hypothetical protein
MLSGHLEQAVDLLVHVVHQEGSSRYTLITYSEFQSRFFEEEFNEVFSHFSTPLTDSHPSSKRVLWRILLVQAHILAALIKTFDSFLEHDRQMVHPVDAISIDELERYNWRPVGDEQMDMAVDADVLAARTYLQAHFKTQPSPRIDG